MSTTEDEVLYKSLYILENEDNPHGSTKKLVMPVSTLDQIIDDQEAGDKTLRLILEELKTMIETGGMGTIIFPVTSVNGKQGDVVLDKVDFDLDKIDFTKDNEKPLSDPQRATIMEILSNYHFEVDLSALEEHLQNSNNPHGVTIEQLNSEGAVNDLIFEFLSRHNQSTSEDTHRDIRNTLNQLQTNFDDLNSSVEQSLERVLESLENHKEDSAAHTDEFNKKEDADNKSMLIDDSYDHKHYPSTRAVVEYVLSKLDEFKDDLHLDDLDGITEVLVINDTNDLPSPGPNMLKRLYFILHGDDFMSAISVCKYQNGVYGWVTTSLGAYTTFDPNYFMVNDRGMSINESSIVSAILDSESLFDKFTEIMMEEVPLILLDYNTKYDNYEYIFSNATVDVVDDELIVTYEDALPYKYEVDFEVNEFGELVVSTPERSWLSELDLRNYKVVDDDLVFEYDWKTSREYLGDIVILPGTQYGSIRYYINGDTSSMTEDIFIPGLKKLAFLEKVDYKNIEDNAVRENHIQAESINSDHLQEQIVGARHMRASYNTIFGNFSDTAGKTVEELSLQDFAIILKPYLDNL